MRAIPLNRVNAVLIFGILICVILHYARPVLVVLSFAVLFAMLMTPVSDKLEKAGVKRIFSTIICLLIIILILSGIIFLVTIQGMNISSQLPDIQSKMEKHLHNLQAYIYDNYNVSPQRQINIMKEQLRSFTQTAGTFFKNFIVGLTGTLASALLVLVFMFLMLYEREKYKAFLLKLYKGDNPEEARHVIERTGKVAQQYLWGRILSIVILTVLYSIGLFIIGIKNAFLLSAIAALLTIIPYIGPLVGGMFPFFMALVTEDSFAPALWVAVVITFIQVVDNYFIEPYVVGGAVNLSAFFTILVLIVGGYLWGVAGVILFLPLFGVVKVVLDNVNVLHPYGYLIGDQKRETSASGIRNWIKDKF